MFYDKQYKPPTLFLDMIKEFKIKTQKKQELIDITKEVKEIVENSKVSEGICLVYVAHSTAGILINENYDKRVCNDIINKLEELIPEKANYEHHCIDTKDFRSPIKPTYLSIPFNQRVPL